MQRKIPVLLLLLMLARMLLPFAFAQALRLPHAHLIIGNVTPEELEEHERSGHTEAAVTTPMLQGGIILSIPFGDWQGFLTAFYAIALMTLTMLGANFFARALRADSLLLRALYFLPVDPPPRARLID